VVKVKVTAKSKYLNALSWRADAAKSIRKLIFQSGMSISGTVYSFSINPSIAAVAAAFSVFLVFTVIVIGMICRYGIRTSHGRKFFTSR